MQSTAPHWTVMLEEVTADTLTEVGAADGAESENKQTNKQTESHNTLLIVIELLSSSVSPATESLDEVPAALMALTVIV